MNSNQTPPSRDIIEIDEQLCNGCGECLNGCAEGALSIVNGKATLLSDIYCDGLGTCLGHCPTGALKIIKRPSLAFDEQRTQDHLKSISQKDTSSTCACPHSAPVLIEAQKTAPNHEGQNHDRLHPSLSSWPIQLKLAHPEASFFNHPVVVLAADCAGFTGIKFHEMFLKPKTPLLIACPKLDPQEPFIHKLAAILTANQAIVEIQVPMMVVPCCQGLAHIAQEAVNRANRQHTIKIKPWQVTLEGQINKG
ncbi:MAG: ATP-binding protein [Candidatus Adiutrix sp.]